MCSYSNTNIFQAPYNTHCCITKLGRNFTKQWLSWLQKWAMPHVPLSTAVPQHNFTLLSTVPQKLVRNWWGSYSSTFYHCNTSSRQWTLPWTCSSYHYTHLHIMSRSKSMYHDGWTTWENVVNCTKQTIQFMSLVSLCKWIELCTVSSWTVWS